MDATDTAGAARAAGAAGGADGLGASAAQPASLSPQPGDDEAILIYVTAPDAAAALALGRVLVEARLAACVNCLPGMRSIYRWQGAVEEAKEAVLLLKTVRSRQAAVLAAVTSAHPAQCPCILVLPIRGGFPPYLDWIRAAVAPAQPEPPAASGSG
jgi:periplasmic divalent cation tolerance protein